MVNSLMTTGIIHIDGILFKMRELRDGTDAIGTPFPAISQTDGVLHASAAFLAFSGLNPVRQTVHLSTKRLGLNGGPHQDDFWINVPEKNRGPVPRKEDRSRFPERTFNSEMDRRLRPQLNRNPAWENVSSLLWQIHGDPDECLYWARRIRNIGGRRTSGYGEVRAWDWLPSNAPPETAGWIGSDGTPIRNLPLRLHPEPASIQGKVILSPARIEPPYSDPDNHEPCLQPSLAILNGTERQGLKLFSCSDPST